MAVSGFTWSIALMSVLLAEGARPAVMQHLSATEARDDVCCCKRHIEKIPHGKDKEETVDIKDHDCAMLKQIRPDRPFWWHPSEQDGARCCWTSGWFCTPTIGFLMLDNNGGQKISAAAERARLCPAATPEGTQSPADKTMAWNRELDEATSRITQILISNAAGMALGAGAAGLHGGTSRGLNTYQAAKTVGKCVRAGEVVLGKAFDGAKKSLSPRQSSVRGDTEGLPKFGGPKHSLERAKAVWKYNNGKLTSDWMHVEEGEDGQPVWVIQDPKTYQPKMETAKCIQDDALIETVCLQTDQGSGFYMKAEIDLSKEVDVSGCDCEP